MNKTHHGTVGIDRVFPLDDRRQVVVQLDSYEWDFDEFGPVEISAGDARFRLRYVGSGAQAGKAVLTLESEASGEPPSRICALLEESSKPIRLTRSEP